MGYTWDIHGISWDQIGGFSQWDPQLHQLPGLQQALPMSQAIAKLALVAHGLDTARVWFQPIE